MESIDNIHFFCHEKQTSVVFKSVDNSEIFSLERFNSSESVLFQCKLMMRNESE